MATEQDRLDLESMANSAPIPTLKLPSIPDAIKGDKEKRKAWNRLEQELDRWRKTLGGAVSQAGGSISISGSTTASSGRGSPGQGVIPPPFIEQDLRSLLIMDWLM